MDDHDFYFHYTKAAGLCSSWYEPHACENYPPLFHLFAQFFTARPEFFLQFAFFMLAVITPLVLFRITGNPITCFFYFATSSYIYILRSGMFTQALAGLLMMSLFATKNNKLRLLIVLLSIIAHSKGLLLVGTIYIILLLQENKGFWNCSPFWGEVPKILETPLFGKNVFPTDVLTINKVLSFFFKVAPIPFLYWSIRELIRRRHWALLSIMAIGFIGSTFRFVIDVDWVPMTCRMLYLIPLPMFIGLTWYYERSRHKKWILALAIGYLLFQVSQFLISNIFC